jgi:hypothetical protein
MVQIPVQMVFWQRGLPRVLPRRIRFLRSPASRSNWHSSSLWHRPCTCSLRGRARLAAAYLGRHSVNTRCVNRACSSHRSIGDRHWARRAGSSAYTPTRRPITPIIIRTGLNGWVSGIAFEASLRALRLGSAVRTGALPAKRGLLLAGLALDLADGRCFDFVLLAFVAMVSSGSRLRGWKSYPKKGERCHSGTPLCFIASREGRERTALLLGRANLIWGWVCDVAWE